MDSNNNPKQPKVAIFNYNKDCQIITGDHPVVVPPGTPVNIFQNAEKKAAKKETSPTPEVSEDSEELRQSVIEDIISRFKFEDTMLGLDNKNHRLTNDRLGRLFGQCFGMRGAQPSQSMKPVVEALWGILIGKRNKCAKRGGEQYFRQTVLNIVGYFRRRNLVCGLPLAIAQILYPDYSKSENESIIKCISRDITSPSFPEGTAEVLDFYINKLKNGEI